jgi:hypothetical protein
MPKAYVLASKGKSFVSRLIKKYQRGFPYTHIAYVLDISDKYNPLVIEAWHLPMKPSIRFPFVKGGGVYRYKFSQQHTPDTEFTIFSIDVTDEQKSKIEEFLFKQLGKEYDFKGIFGFASYSDIQDKDKWFCSELVFAAFKNAGIELLRQIEPYKVSPRLFLLSPYLKKEFDSILKT